MRHNAYTHHFPYVRSLYLILPVDELYESRVIVNPQTKYSLPHKMSKVLHSESNYVACSKFNIQYFF